MEPLENIYRKLTRLDWGFPRRLPARLAAQRRWFLSYAIAVCGGLSFSRLGVPAGAMVGSLFITAVISLLGFCAADSPCRLRNFMLIGLGIVITSNITSETIKSLTPKLLLPILFTLVVIYLTSLLVSFIIYKITGWDYPTCFLASAPAGITAITGLAISFDLDPPDFPPAPLPPGCPQNRCAPRLYVYQSTVGCRGRRARLFIAQRSGLL